MWTRIMETVLLFRNFIGISTLAAVCFLGILCLYTGQFCWQGRKRLIYGWFLGRSDGELVSAGAAFLQFLFVLSATLAGTVMEPAHLMCLLLLASFRAAGRRSIMIFLRESVNSVLLFAAFMVGNILSGYLSETRFNIYVAAVLILLDAFLVLYAGYFFLKDISMTDTCAGERMENHEKL